MSSLGDALSTMAILLFLGVPASLFLGGAVFVPRAYWTFAHLRRVLPHSLWVLAGLVFMLVPEGIESHFDPAITAWFGYDFTPYFAELERGWHAPLQAAFPAEWFRIAIAVVYIAGYPFLIIFTTFLFAWLGDPRRAARALAAYAMCYGLALPFYLFFPVNEVWMTGQAQNLALFHPVVADHLYSFNQVNNCFPSLHTAITVALAYVAWRSDARAYRAFAAVLASLIVFSTFFLGIHWFSDVLAGLVLAGVVAAIIEWALPLPDSRRFAVRRAARATGE